MLWSFNSKADFYDYEQDGWAELYEQDGRELTPVGVVTSPAACGRHFFFWLLSPSDEDIKEKIDRVQDKFPENYRGRVERRTGGGELDTYDIRSKSDYDKMMRRIYADIVDDPFSDATSGVGAMCGLSFSFAF